MANFDKDRLFNAESIRDTVHHISNISNCEDYPKKSIIIHNGLNQDVTIKLQGDINKAFAKPMKLEPNKIVTANQEDYMTSDDIIPFLRVRAICTVAPTTGVLDVWIVKSG